MASDEPADSSVLLIFTQPEPAYGENGKQQLTRVAESFQPTFSQSYCTGQYRSEGTQPPIFLTLCNLPKTSEIGNITPQFDPAKAEGTGLLEYRSYRRLTSRVGRSFNCAAPIITVVRFKIQTCHVDEFDRWYEQEHIGDLAQIPGWRQSRRFRLVEARDPDGRYTELLAIHDFDEKNGLGGPEHDLARARPWRQKIVNLAAERENTTFRLMYQLLVK